MIRLFLHKLGICTLALALVVSTAPRYARAQARPARVREGTPALPAPDEGARRDPSNVLRFGALAYSAEPDSTGKDLEFPDDKESHLARDITVFVIVSVFVAYFVIKVFLEGDTDEDTSAEQPGKEIPGS